jgi:LysR family transcriptional activator of glutamate synthase operon
METEYLNNFAVLAKTGSFSEAANALFISQSTLSKRIFKLESILGVTLFNRTTKHVELNEFGKVYLKYAKQMLMLEEECLNEIKNMLPRGKKTLKIGSIPSMSNYGITELISEFYADTEHLCSCHHGPIQQAREIASTKSVRFRLHPPGA